MRGKRLEKEKKRETESGKRDKTPREIIKRKTKTLNECVSEGESYGKSERARREMQ